MNKLSIQILPTLNDLLRFFKRRSNSNPIDDSTVLLSRSCFSLKIICDVVSARKKGKVNVWFPDFFCGETLNSLRKDNNVVLHFYPLTYGFEPDYNQIAIGGKSIDILIFVHYFGMYLNIKTAREFCNREGVVLIEDCAHVLYPAFPFGDTGDYAIFSPHKCLPIVDGAILKYNSVGYEEDWNKIYSTISCLPRFSSFKQYTINIVKNIFAVKAVGTYFPEPHFDRIKPSEEPSRISLISERILLTYSTSELADYKAQRRKNLELLEKVMQKYSVQSVNHIKESDIPYFGYFMIEDKERAVAIAKEMKESGIPMGVWSYLPYEVQNTKDSNAVMISTYCFSVPIHQKITKKQIMSIAKK